MGLGERKLTSIALMGAAVFAVGALVLQQQRRLAEDRLRGATDAAQSEVRGRLNKAHESLGEAVHQAARLPQLRSAVEDGVDAFTLNDLFKDEDWWAPYRKFSCLLVHGSKVAVARGTIGKSFDEAIGHGTAGGADGKSEPEATVARVFSGETVLGSYVAGDQLFLSAASAVAPGKRGGESGILIFGQLADDDMLNALVKDEPVTLAVQIGGAPVRALGRPATKAIVDSLPMAGATAPVIDKELGWVAAAIEIGGGARLWIVVSRDAVWSDRGALSLLAWFFCGVSLLAAVAAMRKGRRDSEGRTSSQSHAVDEYGDVVGPALSTAGEPSRRTYERSTGVAAQSSDYSGRSQSVPSQRPSASMPALVTPSGSPAAATMMSGQGQPFGRYILLDRIGEGGMSELFIAVLPGAEGFERRFVIKRLKPHLAGDPAAVAQFIDEAKHASQLVHSNIVPVYDFGKVGDGYFLAQEFVAGKNLAQILDQHLTSVGRPIASGLVCYIATEILAGLAYAHQSKGRDGQPLNMVHRDVSPTNVMSSFEGEIKLLDFGIVKADVRRASTDPGNIKGNAAYMSPEQARGQNIDQRSDLFSLGLVIFDLVTGERFYQGSTTGEVLYQAATGPTSEHVARLARLPPDIAEVLRPALSLDLGARYSNALAFSMRLAPLVTRTKTHMAAMMREFFE